jgi:hypothetical protein
LFIKSDNNAFAKGRRNQNGMRYELQWVVGPTETVAGDEFLNEVVGYSGFLVGVPGLGA